jgi:hypothetical protein
MLHEAYGKSTFSKTRACEWYKAFKCGRDVTEDLPRCGRPSTSATGVNIAKMREIVIENPHSTLREIVAELSVSHESSRTILTNNLGIKHVCCLVFTRNVKFLSI